MKLQYRLQLAITLLAGLLLVGVSLFGYFHTRQQMQDTTLEQMSAQVEAQAYQLDNSLQGKNLIVTMLAHSLEGDLKSGQPLKVPAGQGRELYIGLPDGTFLRQQPDDLPPFYDPRQRNWYQFACQSTNTVFTPLTDSVSAEPAIAVARAVRRTGDGTVLGVVGMDVDMTELAQAISALQVSGRGHGLLFDHDGTILAHPERRKVGSNVLQDAAWLTAAPSLLHDNAGVVRYRSSQTSEEQVVAFRRIPTTNWVMALEMSESDIYQPLAGMQQRYLLINLAGLILLMSAVFCTSQKVSHSLRALTQEAQHVAEGREPQELACQHCISPLQRDEVTQLSEAFHRMLLKVSLRENERIRELEAAQAQLAAQNRELVAVNQKLQEVDRIKSEFIATVSHELRTPMTSIRGFSQLIQQQMEAKVVPHINQTEAPVAKAVRQVRRNLAIIVEESGRLTHMIGNVLDIAKLEAGGMAYEKQHVEVEDLMQRAAETVYPLFDQPDKCLILDIPPELPAIYGDFERLLQVMINLLSNAEKFTVAGIVTFGAWVDRGEVLLSVADPGVGIAPEDCERIFEKFVQAGSVLTAKPKGSGLGLSICREIIADHGGRIWVESQLGKGSTFYVALPTAPATLPAILRERE